ncbi:S-adenosyl-l-methionine hydroxide adenosyltransferase family protein [Rossellomorea aquimaris]|uniref:SAM hydrolase/SAM-dependent halogenase family protein n=1 Tax=Rossellomorea aquimaris TaxID=189382 RepID=UPI001CD43B3F|nr:S-adenosyl-l-methionine hydroxide adenosyltransferase family protein [Rossellomorea aquimaris]MCA1054346.1 S-adenosyl-l-methionine hydroxide adenosyltransferase family protein [Rossellomorea aquimaris]
MSKALVLQSDFGISDGAVCAMYGVANGVDASLKIFDLTHDIPQYNIWEGSYRLLQTVSYWPEETVFVSVVDPGVGSDRKSIAVKTASNHYIITPDNGSLTHIAKHQGLTEARIIDETRNRLPNSGESYTFHGRDIYAYTGARLAAGVISFNEIGPSLPIETLMELPLKEATIEKESVEGIIEILDVRFGNLWTNVSRGLFVQYGIDYGDLLDVTIENQSRVIYHSVMTFGRSFADSLIGEPLVYVNSLDNLGVAINQGSFAGAYHIGSGTGWKITFKKMKNRPLTKQKGN